jgi:hypothetical protein
MPEVSETFATIWTGILHHTHTYRCSNMPVKDGKPCHKVDYTVREKALQSPALWQQLTRTTQNIYGFSIHILKYTAIY